MSRIQRLRSWAKARQTPLSRLAYGAVFGLRNAAVPVIPVFHAMLYRMHVLLAGCVATIGRILWYTPLFQSQLRKPASKLFLYSGMPLVLGSPLMSFGERCRVSGNITITGRTSGPETPTLVVGDNCDIGWQTTLAIGRGIVIGNNVRIAGRAFLAGYAGHPMDAAARAAGLPDTEDQIGDIILEDDVWLATGVTISAGVTVGRGTIVAAGSVVTKDLPAFVLAAGVPATVKRSIAPGSGDDASARLRAEIQALGRVA